MRHADDGRGDEVVPAVQRRAPRARKRERRRAAQHEVEREVERGARVEEPLRAASVCAAGNRCVAHVDGVQQREVVERCAVA